jgi:hypothetical protein
MALPVEIALGLGPGLQADVLAGLAGLKVAVVEVEMPAWSAAAVNDFQDRVTGVAGTAPGSTVELPAGMVTDSPKVSLPIAALRTMAAALKAKWPER